MSMLNKGLKVGLFYFLSKSFPCELIEILAHADKYVNMEEGMVEKWKEKGELKMV